MSQTQGESVQIDTDYTDEMVCPWCGHKREESHCLLDDSGADQNGTEECGECGKTFRWNAEIRVTYSTEKSCGLLDTDHDWEVTDKWDFPGIYKQIHRKCRKCGELKSKLIMPDGSERT